MQRLLYCSESMLDPLRAAGEISSIISASKGRNAVQLISGALISTNKYFAQALEGEAGCVADLMQSICRDPRHTRVTIVHTDNINVRRFTTWDLAYRGHATYINGPIEALLSARPDPEKADAIKKIYDMMMEFAKPDMNLT